MNSSTLSPMLLTKV
uniref:Uncharacterized protein n=1 Tax=Anguilla anguilla TaxID=7936 RepID=A0A0E9QUB6_ANGAN